MTQAVAGFSVQPQQSNLLMRSALIFVPATLLIAAVNPRLWHWFVLPVMVCGILNGVEVIRWYRGVYDVFDPRGVVGLIGIVFFWLSFLVLGTYEKMVLWEAKIWLVDPRNAAGIMAAINIVCLIAYQCGMALCLRKIVRPWKTYRALDWNLFPFLLGIFIILALIGQAYLFLRFGVRVLSVGRGEESYVGGTGIITMIAHPLPVLLLLALTVAFRRYSGYASRLITIGFVMCPLLMLGFAALGTSGNRGGIVYLSLWLAGVIHYYWRPFRRKEVIVGFLGMCMFVYFYGFYKWGGLQGVGDLFRFGPSQAAQFIGYDPGKAIVGDLSRAEMHTWAAHIFTEKPYAYDLRWGTTIIGDVAARLPSWLFPNDYNLYGYTGNQEAGTELIHGKGFFNPRLAHHVDRRMWGIGGEFMLNFGLIGFPIGYFFFGIITAFLGEHINAWRATADARLIFAPALIILTVLIFVTDPDVMLNYMIHKYGLPIAIVYMCSRRIARPWTQPAAA